MPFVTVVNLSRGNFTLSHPFGSLAAGEAKTASLTDKQINSMQGQLTNLQKGGFISCTVEGVVPVKSVEPTPEVVPEIVVVPEEVKLLEAAPVEATPEAMPEGVAETVSEPVVVVEEISSETAPEGLSDSKSRKRRN